ncbi:MAG: RNA polymerase sigma factor [Salibacteraceae bacterium]
MTEAQLVEQCLKGNAFAQRRLYDQYSELLMGVCLRYMGSRELAQDVLQEGFIRVFRKLDTYKGEGALGAWIRRIMVNTALEHLRKLKKQEMTADFQEADYLIPEREQTLSGIGAKEIMQLIQQLPVGYRTVLNLYAVEGYNHREIAEQLGISEGTSKSQYSRARNLLKKMLNRQTISAK